MKRLTTLTGPSCAGKTTLESMMVATGCMRAVSSTTRAPREGEQHGVDYYFVTVESFERARDAGLLVESARFGQHWYGVLELELERLFKLCDHVVLVCEPKGAKQIRKHFKDDPNVLLTQVFIDADQEVVARRFIARFNAEMLATLTLPDVEKQAKQSRVIDAYSKRLVIMNSTEREWVKEARWKRDIYDLKIRAFDENNAELVVKQLTLPYPPLA